MMQPGKIRAVEAVEPLVSLFSDDPRESIAWALDGLLLMICKLQSSVDLDEAAIAIINAIGWLERDHALRQE